jgi:glutathione synthase/RimK-type ligase-like ATP-grasp enzyme
MSTKKILIITSRSEKTASWKEREQYVKDFCETVAGYLDNANVLYTTYRDLHYVVRGGVTTVTDTLNRLDLKEVHLVHFKNWAFEYGEAPVVAAYLKAHGIPFFNSEVATTPASAKLAQMVVLGGGGVPVPDTFFASKEQLRAFFERDALPEGFVYPLIMKANDGSRGDDNHLIAMAKEALDVLTASDPEKEYVLQNFIPNDGDYRFLFCGLDATPIIFHRKGADGSHLNNTSKGGSGTFVQSSDITPECMQYARRAAELLGREIGGVDILIDAETGKPYVLEVNGTPALATGYGVDQKAEHFARFVQQQLDAQEEEEEE